MTALETLKGAEKHLEYTHGEYLAAETTQVEAAKNALGLGRDYQAAVRAYSVALEAYQEENDLA